MDPEKNLEEKLARAYDSLNIRENQRKKLGNYLKVLKEKDIPTYQHSIRVGVKGAEVAFQRGMDMKAMLYSGLMHDIGKIAIPDKILKKENFNEGDMEIMKNHTIWGYIMTKRDFAFASIVSLIHHHYQGEKSYPYIKNLATKLGFVTITKAHDCATLLHKIDDEDAKLYRNNNYNNIKSVSDYSNC